MHFFVFYQHNNESYSEHFEIVNNQLAIIFDSFCKKYFDKRSKKEWKSNLKFSDMCYRTHEYVVPKTPKSELFSYLYNLMITSSLHQRMYFYNFISKYKKCDILSIYYLNKYYGKEIHSVIRTKLKSKKIHLNKTNFSNIDNIKEIQSKYSIKQLDSILSADDMQIIAIYRDDLNLLNYYTHKSRFGFGNSCIKYAFQNNSIKILNHYKDKPIHFDISDNEVKFTRKSIKLFAMYSKMTEKFLLSLHAARLYVNNPIIVKWFLTINPGITFESNNLSLLRNKGSGAIIKLRISRHLRETNDISVVKGLMQIESPTSCRYLHNHMHIYVFKKYNVKFHDITDINLYLLNFM